MTSESETEALERTPVNDVWGIGHRWSKMLNGRGIYTAHDLQQADVRWVRQRMGVVGLRTVLELRGTPCHTLETETPDKQTTCCSRTFAKASSDKNQVKNAILSYAERAVEKVRFSGQVCRIIQVFIRTDKHDEKTSHYSMSAMEALITPSADSRVVVATALRVFERIWKEGVSYRKAGVLLLDLSLEETVTPPLFDDSLPGGKPLMTAIDHVNQRYGRGSIGLGLSPSTAKWRMRQEHLSPRYTTRWSDIPRAR